MRRYTSRDEAILREIVEPLREHAEDHDVEAIADAVLGSYAQGYACIVDVDAFWAVVERHRNRPDLRALVRAYGAAKYATGLAAARGDVDAESAAADVAARAYALILTAIDDTP